jgi:hypothetical protein
MAQPTIWNTSFLNNNLCPFVVGAIWLRPKAALSLYGCSTVCGTVQPERKKSRSKPEHHYTKNLPGAQSLAGQGAILPTFREHEQFSFLRMTLDDKPA